jgi:hypothetical protein
VQPTKKGCSLTGCRAPRGLPSLSTEDRRGPPGLPRQASRDVVAGRSPGQVPGRARLGIPVHIVRQDGTGRTEQPRRLPPGPLLKLLSAMRSPFRGPLGSFRIVPRPPVLSGIPGAFDAIPVVLAVLPSLLMSSHGVFSPPLLLGVYLPGRMRCARIGWPSFPPRGYLLGTV